MILKVAKCFVREGVAKFIDIFHPTRFERKNIPLQLILKMNFLKLLLLLASSSVRRQSYMKIGGISFILQ